jgi:hypothetical protein
MSYIIICTVALLVSGLTLFSGFGLGTLLMPAFALFFPVEVAVVVDICRLLVYGSTFFARDFAILRQGGGVGLVVAGSLAAFLGAFIGSRLLKKVTMRGIGHHAVFAVDGPGCRTDLKDEH